jgi:hypothetical protein
MHTHSHGAISLEKLEAECPEQMRSVLFAREIIDHHRVLHFR